MGIRPRVGLNPTNPHQAAGRRTEPPMSVPMCSGPYPAAAAAAAPELEPPVLQAVFQGLRVMPWKLDSPEDNMPKSGTVVLARMIAPASRIRAAGGASCRAGFRAVAALPRGIGVPWVAISSLTVTGIPSSGPLGAPLFQRSVEARASRRTCCGSKA